MPRNTYGNRYPHVTTAARKHECRMCAVVGAIAAAAGSGAEAWGTAHRMPALEGEASAAEDIRDALFAARGCRALAGEHGKLSVSVKFVAPDDSERNKPPVRRPEGYVLVVRVWRRDQAQQEIARRVSAGEGLSYNVMRGK